MNEARVRDQALRLLEQAGPGLAPIVQAGDPVLRAVARPYDGELAAEELDALLALMFRTMEAAPGVGLAAPQIGLGWALAVVQDPGVGLVELEAVRERTPLAPRVLVNPRYTPVEDRTVGFYEGCLSVEGYAAVVARHHSVRLVGWDAHGVPFDEVFTGWPARIVQHETDHLGGVLYIDKAEIRSLAASAGWGGHWALEPVPRTAAAELGFTLP
ncbi:MAG: peptide deformylase [Actinobacteria bacterium]|nr:peptide deformylase [Actinomycetota bacterium]MCG2803453.1 peptide deformylase [Cellulomonas sp.]